jgi:hypothetical protein
MIKVLFISANPFEDYNMDEARELKIIQTALNKSPFPEQFSITHQDDVNFPDFPKLLLDYKPDLLHLSVPSLPSIGWFFDDCKSGGWLIKLQDARDGRIPTRATISSISNILKRYATTIQCLFCTTPVSMQDTQKLLPGTNAVVAFDYLVDNKRAFAFTQGFYEGLFSGDGLQAAYDSGVYRLGQELYNQSKYAPYLEYSGQDILHILTLSALTDTSQSGGIQSSGIRISDENVQKANDIQKLITGHRRRLQKLEEQRAMYGATTEPSVRIELKILKLK